jgi:hypothetical protein
MVQAKYFFASKVADKHMLSTNIYIAQ